MSDVSETKLAGLTLMLGPSLATLLYIIFIAIPSILSSTSCSEVQAESENTVRVASAKICRWRKKGIIMVIRSRGEPSID